MRFRSFAAPAILALLLASPAAAQTVAAAAPVAPPEPTGLRLELNIPAQRLVLFDGDSAIRRYTISVGQPGHDTPDGEFTIQRAEWNPWWRPPERDWAKDDKVTPPGPDNPMGRVKLFFAPYYYLHGTPHEKELGTPASHGCVRMRNTDVIELATILHRRASPTMPASQIPAVLRRYSNTRWVDFRNQVPLTIRYRPVVIEGGTFKVYPDIYRRSAINTEMVYQALIDAGYDPAAVPRATARDLLQRAAGTRGAFALSVHDAFGDLPRAAPRADAPPAVANR
ncbi:MAG TPA: L,D-transpeptidase [Longimicrobiaceae bacterium]|nr:L,D-transpeptidase [Longimicrobiaceae bacterium]